MRAGEQQMAFDLSAQQQQLQAQQRLQDDKAAQFAKQSAREREDDPDISLVNGIAQSVLETKSFSPPVHAHAKQANGNGRAHAIEMLAQNGNDQPTADTAPEADDNAVNFSFDGDPPSEHKADSNGNSAAALHSHPLSLDGTNGTAKSAQRTGTRPKAPL